MLFTWDPRKEASNRAKHGIGFSLAALIFNDPGIISRLDDRKNHREERWNSIGMPTPETDGLLHVTHTFTEDENGEEIIRIISARKAARQERELYSRADLGNAS
jgi:uncharacterized DUF497 family protein